MSAYTNVKSQFNDPQLIVESLIALGYQPVVHKTPVQLVDYRGKLRPQTAEIVIPRRQLSNAANDVGFAKQADETYTAIISQYDSHATFTPAKMDAMKLAYNTAKAKKIASQQGMRLVGEKKTVKNGKTSYQYVFEGR